MMVPFNLSGVYLCYAFRAACTWSSFETPYFNLAVNQKMNLLGGTLDVRPGRHAYCTGLIPHDAKQSFVRKIPASQSRPSFSPDLPEKSVGESHGLMLDV